MSYVERDVTADERAVQEMLDLLGGRVMTPTIVVGDETLLGFAPSRARLEKIFPKNREE